MESFFKRLTEGQKFSIRFLGIDRANACRRHLAEVEVCYDAYHLAGNINKVVDKVRRAGMSHPTEALKRRLKGKRYHLPGPKKISKRMQEGSLPGCPLTMKSPYHLCTQEQFRTVFCAETENGATLQLIQWLRMAVVPGVKQVEKLARGITGKFHEVINGVRYGINPGGSSSASADLKQPRNVSHVSQRLKKGGAN